MSATSGKLFLHAIVGAQSVSELLSFGKIEHLFRPSEKEVYTFIQGFVKTHFKVPDAETIESHTGEALAGAKEPPSYYMELMQQRYVETELKSAMKKASDNLSVTNKNPKAALETLLNTALQLNAVGQQHMVSDFRFSKASILAAYAKQFNGTSDKTVFFGWPTLDEMSGGIGQGDMVSFVGRPAKGKTWQMLKSCLHGWNSMFAEDTKPASRMFVSMEMPKIQIEQRLAALHLKLSHDKIKKAGLTTLQLNKLKEGLTLIQGFGAPFYVVDGNLTATVDDVHSLAIQLQPDGIWIDGGYLMKHVRERDRFKRVAENADEMKTKLAPIAPLVVSWQFAKSGAKKGKEKKEGIKPDGEDIGYSDAILQVSTLAVGITEPDSVETMQSRELSILKGRNGEVGSFRTKWDFNTMDFDEIVDQDLSELQFL